MVIKVGINGFGRIGRIVFRACLQNSSLQLSAVNDPAISVEYICYLIKFDSTHGKLNVIITQNNDEIVVNGVHVKVFHERSPPAVPWQAAGSQYVVEASGMFTNYEKASGHLASIGVRRVIVTAPSVDIPMVILGVNDNNIPQDCRVISCASSTLYCLAPIIKVLEDSFGVEEGFITSIHAMTPSLKPLDGLCLRGKHWRDYRSIHQNIIPGPTGACKALGRILAGSKDKLSGLALRVPVVNVSALDLTVRLQINTSIQEIVNSVEHAGKNNLRNIIKVSNDEAVSSDFMGETYSCIFDESSSIQLKPNFFKLICWYENEYSYACRIIDSITFSENQYFLAMPISMKKIKPVTTSKMLQINIPQRCSCRTGVTCEMLGLPRNTDDRKRTLIPFVPKQCTTTIDEHSFKDHQRAKKEDLLKIWNNSSEIAQSCVKPIKCPFFQSCVGFPQTSLVKVECTNKERLENVRREFTKMVSITEDILRKTQSNQGVRSKSKDEMNQVSRANFLSKEKDAKSSTIMNNKIKSVEEIVDIKCSGDTIQTQTDKSYRDDMSFASNLTEKPENDDNNNEISENIIDISKAIKKLKSNDENKDEKAPILLQKEGSKEGSVKLNTGVCKKSSETAILANDKEAQNKEFNFVWYSQHNNRNKQTNVKHKTVNTELSSSNGDHVSNQEKQTFPETNTFKYQKDKITFNKLELLTKKSNMNLFDEALRKRNILLVNESIAENESKPCDEVPDDSPAESDDTVTVAKPLVVNYPLKEKSKCTTIDNTVMIANSVSQVCVTEKRQDIYDKLESTGGSGSNNSFEIKERKSQVIQLTDLTNSLEDLTRLNTICRIIEISDELSDQLFSALDDPGPDMKKKRWSFKDLCARIKLDEFCNKVFGGITLSHD